MLAEGMITRFTADKESGLLPADFDPPIVVPIIITYLQELFPMALVSEDRPKSEQQISLFLQDWDSRPLHLHTAIPGHA